MSGRTVHCKPRAAHTHPLTFLNPPLDFQSAPSATFTMSKYHTCTKATQSGWPVRGSRCCKQRLASSQLVRGLKLPSSAVASIKGCMYQKGRQRHAVEGSVQTCYIKPCNRRLGSPVCHPSHIHLYFTSIPVPVFVGAECETRNVLGALCKGGTGKHRASKQAGAVSF